MTSLLSAMLLSATTLVPFADAPGDAREGWMFPYTMRTPSLEDPPDPIVESRYTTVFLACRERTVSTLDSRACYDREFARQDAILNQN